MTYYQTCCTLVAAIIAIAIHTDPVVNYIFTHPIQFLTRFFFGLFYFSVTTPSLVFWMTINYPMTSIQFYSWVMVKYFEVYPESLEEEYDSDAE